MTKESLTEIQKLRKKQAPYQLQFPELFKSDTSINPSYTNLKLPYQVICRERRDAYRRLQALQRQAEVLRLAERQTRAWDGVRVARVLGGPSPRTPVRRLPDPLSPSQRQRLYRILEL